MLLHDAGMTAAVLLAGVLAWAGAAKLQRRAATADAFAALGIPRPRQAALAVPVAELVVAVLLIALPLVGAVPALLMLATFTWVIVQKVTAGATVPCACFGQPNATPLSWTEVVRNALLVVLGVLALFAGPAHIPGPAGALAVAALGLAALGLLTGLRRRARA